MDHHKKIVGQEDKKKCCIVAKKSFLRKLCKVSFSNAEIFRLKFKTSKMKICEKFATSISMSEGVEKKPSVKFTGRRLQFALFR